MASKLEEKLVHRMLVRAEYEQRMRDTLSAIADCNLAVSRRCLAAQIACWLDAHERCNELSRELADSIEPELVAPVETFRGRAVAV